MTLFPDFIRFGATLRIDIAQKLTEPEDRRVVWSHADAPEIFDELHLKGDLVAEVLVSPEGPGKCLVTGTLSGVQTLTCSRTLDLFDRPFTTEIVAEVERLPIAKQELDEDELQEPVAPVKNPDEDFIFVSNNQPDEGSEEAKPLDPRWEKLKALKSKMENRS